MAQWSDTVQTYRIGGRNNGGVTTPPLVAHWTRTVATVARRVRSVLYRRLIRRLSETTCRLRELRERPAAEIELILVAAERDVLLRAIRRIRDEPNGKKKP